MAEADHAPEAENEVEAHCRDGEDHHSANEVEVEGLVRERGHDGHEAQHEQAGHQREHVRAGAHQPRTAGNNPCGRKASTAAIRM